MKFCPYCGANIGKFFENMTDGDAQADLQTVAEVKKEADVVTKQGLIETMFWNVFKIRGKFGSSVYFIGKDTIPEEFEENLKEYLVNSSQNEKVLMVFKYSDSDLKEGFVITDKRLVWHYDSYGMCEILLDDIKEVRIGKAMLATVMNVISVDNEIYPQIYLTGINSEGEFVLKFRSFIYDIQKLKNAESHGKGYENSTEEKTDIVECIIHSCNSVKMDSIYCEMGNPITMSSRKYINAKAYFGIPDSEDIYMIYDETILGGCKRGFALCTSGFYYCRKQSGYIEWSKFKDLKITKSMGAIIVGTEEFNTASDSKQILTILLTMQELLKK